MFIWLCTKSHMTQTVASVEDQFDGNSVSLLAYDSVLAVAKTLDNAVANSTFAIRNCSSRTMGLDEDIGEAIRESMKNVSFKGASVRLLK